MSSLACETPTRLFPDGRTGTSAGYTAHRAAGEGACSPCLDAVAEKNRTDRAALDPGDLKNRKHDEYIRNRDQYQNNNLRTRFGITLDDYDELLASQGGKCAICGSENPGGRWGVAGRFHVDHDHACCPGHKSCGKCIRGLLCAPCNVGLGAFRDSPNSLAAAFAYITSWRSDG